MSRFKNELIKGLFEELRFAPARQKKLQLDSAVGLYDIIDPAKEHA